MQTIFAPAKINLYLHVIGRRADGYHELDSLIAFADIGDEIQITAGEGFSFEITGPFENAFQGRDIDSGPKSSNLAVRAVWALSRLTQKAPSFKITLEKNLPLGAGIGGGSADAAAVLWGLLEHWNLPKNLEGLEPLMLSLGADVPVCFACKSLRITSIGEKLERAPEMPEMPIVLVHPGKACNTKEIFDSFEGSFKDVILLPERFDHLDDTIEFLEGTNNMLKNAAFTFVPEIQNILAALQQQNGCRLARMSGSGSTCFSLFDDGEKAERAAKTIKEENPDWWVKNGWLGRPKRY